MNQLSRGWPSQTFALRKSEPSNVLSCYSCRGSVCGQTDDHETYRFGTVHINRSRGSRKKGMYDEIKRLHTHTNLTRT